MKAIHIKLWRDLKRLRAQVVTIAMVVAIGVAGFVGMFSVHQSLQGSRDHFYRDNRLADVFASVKRAPVHLRERLAALDGVAEVKLDVVFDAQVDLPEVVQPVSNEVASTAVPLAPEVARAVRELAAAGVPQPPTHWLDRGVAADVAALTDDDAADALDGLSRHVALAHDLLATGARFLDLRSRSLCTVAQLAAPRCAK